MLEVAHRCPELRSLRLLASGALSIGIYRAAG
jgi:hypothetical protein